MKLTPQKRIKKKLCITIGYLKIKIMHIIPSNKYPLDANVPQHALVAFSKNLSRACAQFIVCNKKARMSIIL
jgi:hypothetical protein